ncbi:hypothetical protein [Peribacillus alkalitolerans]|uniref:hypothetical protein n=1 Tax=Peribacillus alkalitolerans TaxID=1550385 RepID=UPI0013D7F30E|nr:hypothetical protein [Peribacillus alkalitolerans]
MSDYQQFLSEREKIDFMIEKGYRIKGVNENLSGSFVEFENTSLDRENTETLHIQTAEARKYFSVILIKQQQKTG